MQDMKHMNRVRKSRNDKAYDEMLSLAMLADISLASMEGRISGEQFDALFDALNPSRSVRRQYLTLAMRVFSDVHKLKPCMNAKMAAAQERFLLAKPENMTDEEFVDQVEIVRQAGIEAPLEPQETT